MPTFPFGETVVIHSRTVTGQDRLGGDMWATTDTTIDGVAVWPRVSTENLNGQDLVITGITALLPAGTTVLPTDRVTVRGRLYDLVGDPGLFQSPLTGTAAGLEVQLVLATG